MGTRTEHRRKSDAEALATWDRIVADGDGGFKYLAGIVREHAARLQADQRCVVIRLDDHRKTNA